YPQPIVVCKQRLTDLAQALHEPAWQHCRAAEHARAARLRCERDARRYRAAHAAMRHLLSQALSLPRRQIAYVEGPHGKPALAPNVLAGVAGDVLHFNLSHSGEWALLGLSRSHVIGVDIECHKDMSDMGGVARQVFNAPEQQALAACGPAERATLFYRTWVGKEACLKAFGSGLSIAPRCVRAPWSSQWSPATVTVADQVHDMRMQGLVLPIQGEAVEGAVALW